MKENRALPPKGHWINRVNDADMSSLIASDIGTVRSVDFDAHGI